MDANAQTPRIEDLLARRSWARRLARSLVHEDAEAGDLLQDAWLAASGGPPSGVDARDWLAGVLRITGLRRARAGGRRRQREAQAGGEAFHVAGDVPGTDVLLEALEAQRLVAELLMALAEPFRTTILLRYFEDLTAAEISRRTGVPAGTVRWRLKTGLEKLRAALDARHGSRRAWALALAPLAGGLGASGANAAASGVGRLVVAALGVATLGAATVLYVSSRGEGPMPATGAPLASPVPRGPDHEPKELEMKKGTLAKLALAIGLGVAADAGAAAPTPAPAITAPAAHIPRYQVPLGAGPMRGPAKAKVTILAFTDYECPFCAKADKTVEELVAKHAKDVRLQIVHAPLPFHENAPLASRAALAAAQQGKFWEMHALIFRNNRALDRPSLEGHARALGLDLARFRADVDGATVNNLMELEEANVKTVKVSGTPTFFFNGRAVVGAQPAAAFEKVLEEELAYADELLASGVKPQDLYNEVIESATPELPKPTREQEERSKRAGGLLSKAKKSCLGGDKALAEGLRGVTVTPVQTFTVPPGKTLTPEQSKAVGCLMQALKDTGVGTSL